MCNHGNLYTDDWDYISHNPLPHIGKILYRYIDLFFLLQIWRYKSQYRVLNAGIKICEHYFLYICTHTQYQMHIPVHVKTQHIVVIVQCLAREGGIHAIPWLWARMDLVRSLPPESLFSCSLHVLEWGASLYDPHPWNLIVSRWCPESEWYCPFPLKETIRGGDVALMMMMMVVVELETVLVGWICNAFWGCLHAWGVLLSKEEHTWTHRRIEENILSQWFDTGQLFYCDFL